MWKRTYSKTFQEVSSQSIWKIWTDVNAWPSWHGDLDFCKLEGEFVVGNHFTLKPKGAKPVKIDLIEIKEGKRFTDCTSFLGAKMYDTHAIEETTEGVKLTNTLWVTGPLKWLWGMLVAQHIAQSIPEKMEALVDLARSYDEA